MSYSSGLRERARLAERARDLAGAARWKHGPGRPEPEAQACSAGVSVSGCTPRAAARRASVRQRQGADGCRSSLVTAVRLIPAWLASRSWDRPRCWRNRRN